MNVRALWAALAWAVAASACDAFGGADDDTGTPSGGKSDAGSDGPPVVEGKPAEFTISGGAPVRLAQGGSVKVGVKVARNGVSDTIRVTVANLPDGIVAKELDLVSASAGDLELSATNLAKQGAIPGATLVASTVDGRRASAPLDLFIRGMPGTLDSTYASGGVTDLGPATTTSSRRSASHIFVAFGASGSVSIRRFMADGSPDAVFPALTTTSALFAVGQDESLFVMTNPTVTHYTSTGTLDAAYGTDGKSAAVITGSFAMPRDIAVNAALEAVTFGHNQIQTQTQAAKVTSAGVIAADFAHTPWTRPTGGEAPGHRIVAQVDGTFLAGVGSSTGVATLLRITSSGAVDSTFAGGAGYSDAPLGPTASALSEVAVLRPAADGTFLLATSNKTDKYAVARFTADGLLDASFGDAASPGVAWTPVRPFGSGGGLDLDSTGRPIVATVTSVGSESLLSLSRFTPAGKLDTTFAPAGFVTLPFGSVKTSGVIVIDSERALVVGTRDGNAFVARFWM